jgi:hypothetical protein
MLILCKNRFYFSNLHKKCLPFFKEIRSVYKNQKQKFCVCQFSAVYEEIKNGVTTKKKISVKNNLGAR